MTIDEQNTDGSVGDGNSNGTADTGQSDNKQQSTDIMDEESPTCGWFNIRPQWMQRFNTAAWLATTISSLMFVQGIMINGFVVINLSTIETRFGISSTMAGFLFSAYDLTVVVLILFVSYFGATRNKAKMLGIGAVIMGCGSLLWAIPHFTTGLYQYDTGYGEEETLCRRGQNVTDSGQCDEEWQNLAYYFWVFLFAQILFGIGASPVYTVGYAYVDENVGNRTSAWYTGLLTTFSVLGPCFGFVLGALFLGIYTDVLYADEVTITPSDPSWVGAWWIGFLLGWVLSWLVALPVASFPPVLPGAKDIQHERTSQAHHSENAEMLETRPGFGEGWKDMWPATKILLTNPTFLLLCIARILLYFIVGGFTPFMPKFLENQFGLTSSAAGLLLGATAIPGAAGGTLLGGWVIKKRNLQVKGALRFCLGITLITLIATPCFLMKCPEQQVAGVIAPYDQTETGSPDPVNLTHACNAGCQCAGSETYNPVCASNDLVYFDACYAGCQNTKYTDEGQTYYNCSCIDTDENDDSPEAVISKCDLDCWQLPVFAFLFFLVMLLGFTLTTPYLMLLLRVVPDSQRAYALGISSITYRIFGSVPGPIVVGAIIDSSCLLWQEVCDERGSCWIYDNFAFGLKFFVVGISAFLLTIIVVIAALLVYKPPPADEKGIEVKDKETTIRNSTSRQTMEEEGIIQGTMNREVSSVSLLGYTRRDLDQADIELVEKSSNLSK
ncbi:solute carrier organic anion transporter family member 4C1-like [Glandiceps talaboti]